MHARYLKRHTRHSGARTHLEVVAARARGQAHLFQGPVGHDKLLLFGAAHPGAAGCGLAVSDLVVPGRARAAGAGGQAGRARRVSGPASPAWRPARAPPRQGRQGGVRGWARTQR